MYSDDWAGLNSSEEHDVKIESFSTYSSCLLGEGNLHMSNQPCES